MKAATLASWALLVALAGWRAFSRGYSVDFAVAVMAGRVILSAAIAGAVVLIVAVSLRVARGRWPNRLLLSWGLSSVMAFLLLELFEWLLLR